MNLPAQTILEMKAQEGFIRRASSIDSPFMLKGSYVTRQYFHDPNDRIPADLDWVYLEEITEDETASLVFSEWATAVTKLDLDDGVKFQSFQGNLFWNRIDYAMSDDFPTVNTYIKCWVNGVEVKFGMDVSFNLDVEQPPLPLLYKPISGEDFIVPLTVPISLQVSWKIHQTLVRPRFKDLLDLTYLVQHPAFDKKALDDALQALVNECHADGINSDKLLSFFNYDIERLFTSYTVAENEWEDWRHNIWEERHRYDISNLDCAGNTVNLQNLPINLYVFLEQFEQAMKKAGFVSKLFLSLPAATRFRIRSKMTYHQPHPGITVQNTIDPPAKPNGLLAFLKRWFE